MNIGLNSLSARQTNKAVSRRWLYGFLLLFLIGKCFTFHHGFFWDHTAGYALPADYLRTHGFLSFIYPAHYVAEPPLAHLYLAGLWTVLGRSLFVAHLSVTLFSLGVFWQLYRLCEETAPRYAPWLFLTLALEPALLTQSLLLSPDILLCFFALLSIRFLLADRRAHLALSAVCLGLVSLRGFVVCAGLGLGYLLIQLLIRRKSFREALAYALPPFLPVLVALGGWFVYRKIEIGYWLYAPDFAYREHREWADAGQGIKNLLGFGFRMVDSGRIIVWLFFLAAVFKIGLKAAGAFLCRSSFALLYLSVLFVLLWVTLPVTNPFGDRYFLVLFILLALVTAQLLLQTYTPKQVRAFFICMILVLASGHAWVYPEKIAKAWDSVLSHVPYYALRNQMIRYLETERIAPAEVAASFPLNAAFGDTEVTDDPRSFAALNWEHSRYILYSNVYNWDDDSLAKIHSANWVLLKEFKSGFVCMRLYRAAHP